MVRRTHLWSHDPLKRGDVLPRDRIKGNISSLTRLTTMKLGKLVTYDEVKALMKSHVSLITWSHEFM